MSENKKYNTREEWLIAAKNLICKHFEWFDCPKQIQLGVYVLKPNVRGQCSGLKGKPNPPTIDICIDAGIVDPIQVMSTLIHELCHAWQFNITGTGGHGGDFKSIAKRFGLIGKAQSTEPDEHLQTILTGFAMDLGDYPNKKAEKGLGLKLGKPDEEKLQGWECICGVEASIKKKHTDNTDADVKCPICQSVMTKKERGRKKKD